MLNFLAWGDRIYAACGWWFNWGQCEVKPPIGCDSKDCLSDGVGMVGRFILWITKKPISVYAQDTVIYLLWFVSIVAVIYIIYAGFQILIGWGDEEKVKKSKNIILYVIVGIVIMWLAYAIVQLIMGLLVGKVIK